MHGVKMQMVATEISKFVPASEQRVATEVTKMPVGG